MSYNAVVVVNRPGVPVAGFSILRSLWAAKEQRTVKVLEENFDARTLEIRKRVDSAKHLARIYPENGNFNDDTQYRVIIGWQVESLDVVPPGEIDLYVAVR